MTACPKPRPRLLDKRERAADLARINREESAKVKARSGGRCEVIVAGTPWTRCNRRGTQIHHLIGGSGRRNVGRSVLAAHKLNSCLACHHEITGHVLKPWGPQSANECAADVLYYRVGKERT
jgi:hypothetical protein